MTLEQIVIWIAGLTAGMALVLLLIVLVSRAVFNFRRTKFEADREHMRPLLFGYLNQEVNPDNAEEEALSRMPATLSLIFSLISSLSGSERTALISLGRRMGMIRRLTQGLKSGSWRVRERSAAQLGMLMLPESVPNLAKLLEDPRLEVRQTAARSLAMSSTDAGFSAFLDLLRKPKQVELSRLLEIVQYLPQPKVEPIIELFEDESVDVEQKLLLLNYITDWGDYHFIRLLNNLLDSENMEIKIRAIKTLARIESHESLPRIIADIDHPSWEIRVQVIRAIRRMEFAEAAQLLVGALDDENYLVRYNAAQTLTSFGYTSSDDLSQLESGSEFARQMFNYHSQRQRSPFTATLRGVNN